MESHCASQSASRSAVHPSSQSVSQPVSPTFHSEMCGCSRREMHNVPAAFFWKKTRLPSSLIPVVTPANVCEVYESQKNRS